jgi:hypothetical protein
MKVIRWLLVTLIVLFVLPTVAWKMFWFWAARQDTGWSAPREEQGPLPLSSPGTPIKRLIKTRETFEVTLREVLWDEGNGPVPMEERVKPVVNAVPKELLDRLRLTRNVPRPNGKGRFDQPIYDAWGTVVSVNPDVLIVTVRERPQGSYEHLFQEWFETAPRGHFIRERLEWLGWCDCEMPFHAGPLVPWSDEMYIVSTDPKVRYARLKFENDQATVLLPDGKLVLHHHDDDVDVTRR